MRKAKIFYFSLKEQGDKAKKINWFNSVDFKQIDFDHIQPDARANWINLTDNDFDDFLPLIDKEVKAGKSEEAIFQLFSAGVKTQRDEWVYDFSKESLIEKVKYLIDAYMEKMLEGKTREFDIKWDAETNQYLNRKISKTFQVSQVVKSLYRPYIKQYFYSDKHFNGRTYQMYNIFPNNLTDNQMIGFMGQSTDKPFSVIASSLVTDLNCISPASGGTQCLPLYRYDQEGNRLENITDWGLKQFQTHYTDQTITKENIFHYVYAVLHNPDYRQKYEQNLKRDFPRIPLYDDFFQWVEWGQKLMDLHINYETIEPYPLKRVDIAVDPPLTPLKNGIDPPLTPLKKGGVYSVKAKLRADKIANKIILDDITTLENIPQIAWEYKLGNRSALEWILDQYKEKKPKDPTIAEKFNTYRFVDYKEQVIDLLTRVCTVSFETMQIIESMDDEKYPEPSADLAPYLKHYGRSKAEQIQINQKGLAMLRRWREEKLSDEDLKEAETTWEEVKKSIDKNRSRKLFS
jgi:predicted helicase